MQSETFTVLPILGCLFAAEKYLKEDMGQPDCKVGPWTGHTPVQNEFLSQFGDHIFEVGHIPDVLKSIAHKDTAVVNQWLQDNGFDIQLDSNYELGSHFSVACILDVLVKWLEKGKVTHILYDGASYPAVNLEHGVSILTGGNNRMIAAIKTQGDETLYMSPIEDRQSTGHMWANELLRSMPNEMYPDESYDSVTFPMVDYDQEIDIKWLEGLSMGNPFSDWYISQALQQTKFRMNEVGARAESAVALGMRCLCMVEEKKTLVIDKPFLLWIRRKGFDIPLFVGVFAEDSWKKPEGLENKSEKREVQYKDGHLFADQHTPEEWAQIHKQLREETLEAQKRFQSQKEAIYDFEHQRTNSP